MNLEVLETNKVSDIRGHGIHAYAVAIDGEKGESVISRLSKSKEDWVTRLNTTIAFRRQASHRYLNRYFRSLSGTPGFKFTALPCQEPPRDLQPTVRKEFRGPSQLHHLVHPNFAFFNNGIVYFPSCS